MKGAVTTALAITSRRWASRFRLALGLFVLAGGVIALLHLGPGLALLRRASVVCPAMAATPESVTRARAMGLAALRTGATGPARPALGFALDVSREGDVDRWAARVGAICARRTRGFTFVDCRPRQPIDAAASGAAERLDATSLVTFAFGVAGTLASVDLFHRPGTPARATRLFQAACAQLAVRLGEPADRAGAIEDVARSRQPMTTALVRYRFADYLATVTAVRLPSGLVVREQYQSAR